MLLFPSPFPLPPITQTEEQNAFKTDQFIILKKQNRNRVQKHQFTDAWTKPVYIQLLNQYGHSSVQRNITAGLSESLLTLSSGCPERACNKGQHYKVLLHCCCQTRRLGEHRGTNTLILVCKSISREPIQSHSHKTQHKGTAHSATGSPGSAHQPPPGPAPAVGS